MKRSQRQAIDDQLVRLNRKLDEVQKTNHIILDELAELTHLIGTIKGDQPEPRGITR